MIDNPEYTPVDRIFDHTIRAVGVEIWQVKSGTIFGDVLLTDDIEYAKSHGERNWEDLKDAEKKMFEAEEEKRRASEEAARKAAEEARKAQEASEKENDVDDDDEDAHDHEL